MATTYSSWSASWTPSGSSTARRYRAGLVYTITTYPTYVSVTAYSVVNLNASASTTFTGTLGATGYSTASGNVSTKYNGATTVTTVSSRTYTWNRTTSAQTKYVSATAKHTSGSVQTTQTATLTVSVPALDSYQISYNANGGSGSIANQTKWYGSNIILSDGTGMTWAHHTLKGWNTAADGSGTHYELGATYTANAALTLYAEWELNAIESRTKVNGSWKNGIFYYKVNGTWVIPYAGYIKVNGVWKQIIRKET